MTTIITPKPSDAGVEYRIYQGSVFQDSYDDEDEARKALKRWRKRTAHLLSVPVLLRVDLMADGKMRTTPADPGWFGECTSTVWVPAPAPVVEQARYHHRVGTSQAWYRTGFRPEGYRLACERGSNHADYQCGAEVFPGTWHEWVPSLLDGGERIA